MRTSFPKKEGINKKQLALIVAVILLLVLLLPNPVEAQPRPLPIDVSLNPVDWVVDWVLDKTLLLMSGLASLLGWIMSMSVNDGQGKPLAVIETTWGFARDFANMFFIVGLIIMAFATIFDVSKYNFRTLIAKFLVVALLMNFSLTIGVTIIDWSQAVSNVFLTSMGLVEDRLGQAISPSILLGEPDPSKINKNRNQLLGISNQTVAHVKSIGSGHKFFSIILGMMFVFSLSVAVVMALIRIPILWALLIISPLAWVASIFPYTADHSRKWWKSFISWNIFLPVYLFFLYFGIYMLSKQEQIMGEIALGAKNQVGDLGASFQSIFFYILIAIFMIGGAKIAMGAAMAGGAGGVAAGTWARGKAIARFGTIGATGIAGAWQAKRKELREEGYRIPFTQKRVFGEQQLKEREAWIGSTIPGFKTRGVELQQQREFLGKTEKEYKNIQDQFAVRTIDEKGIETKAKGSASNPEVYAYRKMMAKLGKLSPEVYKQTLQELSRNPLAAQDFAKAAKETDFSNILGSDLIEMTTGLNESGTKVHEELRAGNFVPAHKEAARFIQSKEETRKKLTQAQFNVLVDTLGGASTKESKDFIKEVGENRPDLGIEYSVTHTDLRDRLVSNYNIPTQDASGVRRSEAAINSDIRQRYYDGVVATDAASLAKMPFVGVWQNRDFRQALQNHIASFPDNRARTRFMTRLSEELHKIKDGRERAAKEALIGHITARLRAGNVIP